MIHSSHIVSGASERGFSTYLRLALWAAPLLTCSAWLTQWLWRFPPMSLGAGLTAGSLALGVLVGAMAASFACFRLIRTPTARTIESYALAGINLILLFVALLAGYAVLSAH